MSPRLLGLDIGEKRIGVAVSDENGSLALPVTVINRRSRSSAVLYIAGEVRRYKAEGVVVGMPYSLRGEMTQQSRSVEGFCRELSTALTVPVTTWDERFTTVAAEQLLLQGGLRKKDRRKRLDSSAAALILQGYLDHLRTGNA